MGAGCPREHESVSSSISPSTETSRDMTLSFQLAIPCLVHLFNCLSFNSSKTKLVQCASCKSRVWILSNATCQPREGMQTREIG